MIAKLLIVSAFILSVDAVVFAASATAPVNLITAEGVGTAIGSIMFTDTKWGLMATPDLSGLPPGVHGFHIHQKAACGPATNEGKPAAGFAAGGHLDPQHTGKHLGPYGSGHEGDLPPLIVNADGKATTPVLAPRLTVAGVEGHSIMIHAGGDNFSDHPLALGGGGARIACGVIP